MQGCNLIWWKWMKLSTKCLVKYWIWNYVVLKMSPEMHLPILDMISFASLNVWATNGRPKLQPHATLLWTLVESLISLYLKLMPQIRGFINNWRFSEGSLHPSIHPSAGHLQVTLWHPDWLYLLVWNTLPETNRKSPWKWMVGIQFSYWDSAYFQVLLLLVSGRVNLGVFYRFYNAQRGFVFFCLAGYGNSTHLQDLGSCLHRKLPFEKHPEMCCAKTLQIPAIEWENHLPNLPFLEGWCLPSLKLTANAPRNRGPLEKEIPIGNHQF